MDNLFEFYEIFETYKFNYYPDGSVHYKTPYENFKKHGIEETYY